MLGAFQSQTQKCHAIFWEKFGCHLSCAFVPSIQYCAALLCRSPEQLAKAKAKPALQGVTILEVRSAVRMCVCLCVCVCVCVCVVVLVCMCL